MSLAFDTLRASRTLRDAGVDERAAEAFVSVVTQAAALPDTTDLATKKDLELAKAELRTEMRAIQAETADVLRQQGWSLFAAMAGLVAIATAVIKLVP